MPVQEQHKNHPAKIMVIKLGALGDFIQALGPMAAIRKHHRDAHITLLTTAGFEKMAYDCGYFDQVWIDQRPKFLNIAGWQKLKKRLNSENFDRVYDLQNNDRTSFYYKLLHKKPEWVGTAKGASHRNTSPERTAGHAFDGHVQTLGLAGIENIEIDKLEWMTENISSFPLHKPYVLFIPGSAPSHPQKRWPAKYYGRLAKILIQTGYQPVLLGTKDESNVISHVKEECPEALDLCGQTSLAQITTMARQASGAIGNDTGPMHLIAATGCPALVLFSGHSNPVRHAPRGGNVSVVQRDNLENLKPEEVLAQFLPREEPDQGKSQLH